jgi:hypothetical protein
MLQNLQRAYRRYPWVREAFLRNDLAMEQTEVQALPPAGP